jgi:cell fate regulator YaaT (PSP1 superfamily)
MGMMMAVSFERSGRLYYLDPGPHSPAVGDKVLVPTDAGPEVAEVIWAPQYVDDEITGLPVCAGLATDEHLSRDEANRTRRAEGRVVARRLVREHDLPMKVVAVDYVDSPDVFTIYFSAPKRVDFRALVRDLAARLRARVELRQIGPRDEARLQGGIGPCGRDLCCATFLKDFEPVSVRMAKDQDLPVNPLRIAGACGRLMCCLKYEHPLYQKFRQEAPRIGSTVESPEGPGTVVGHNVPGDKVVVKLAEDGRRCACPKASVCGSRQAYEAKYGSGQ